MDLVSAMKAALADTFAFYLKAQYYHWNVEGPDFKQYHDLFSTVYETAYEGVDQYAEEIRALDAYAPGSLSRFAELTRVVDDNTVPPALEMVRRIAASNETVLASIEEAYEAAEAAHKHGLSNFLAERQDAHSKLRWMLNATLKAQGLEAATLK